MCLGNTLIYLTQNITCLLHGEHSTSVCKDDYITVIVCCWLWNTLGPQAYAQAVEKIGRNHLVTPKSWTVLC